MQKRCRGAPSIVVLMVLILFCGTRSLAQDFGYEGRSGPQHWGEEYARCTGKHQSPINVRLVKVKLKAFPQLEFHNFNVVPQGINVTNNGHTVLVKMTYDEGKVPSVRGGPLAKRSTMGYQFEQFHFHWGENDTIGSEDLIDNHAYPAELHMVLRNLEYPDFASALDKDHGIAVMAFFFQIAKTPTGGYEEFTKLLSQIDRKGESINVTNPLPLREYITKHLGDYYSYTGSLTTPPCSEEVTWLDFKFPIDITEDQLNAFRSLTAHDDHLKNNFRPIQPLNDRLVYMNTYREPLFVDAANSAGRMVPPFLSVLRLLF